MTRRRGRLAVRIYAFTVATVVLSIVLVTFLIKITGNPPWLRAYGTTVATLTRQLSERYPTRDALLAHVGDATRAMDGSRAIYQRGGGRLWLDGGSSSASPTADEWRTIERGGTIVIDDDYIIAAIPGHPDLAFVHHPTHHFPGLGFAIALVAMLILVLLSSVWFARGLVRPLRRLEAAAIGFGEGDATTRAQLDRPDELGAVGRAFDSMADRIEQLLRVQRELLADISHELRTPLARIRVAIELATEDPEAARDVLGEVGIDLGEIDQIIDDLLTVVRLDGPSAATRLPHGAVSLDELVGKARDRFASLHPRRALRIGGHDDAAIHAAVIRGHGPLLRRALDNLLDNAAKYSPAEVPIVLATWMATDGVVLEVIDRGVGMSADELAHAFTPFWRADDSRSRGTGGVGLGLALARRVARAHGGDVTLRSQPGAGTTASLSLPR